MIIVIFEIHTDYQIPSIRPDHVKVNKKENLPNNRLCHPGRSQSENQRKWKERQVLGPC